MLTVGGMIPYPQLSGCNRIAQALGVAVLQMRESQTSIEEHPKFATGRAMAMQASNGMEFHMLGKTRLTTGS